MQEFTINDLGRIVRECAGEAEALVWDSGIADRTFADLGYDSLAMLEVASRVEREYGFHIEDGDLTALSTPRAFVEYVGGRVPA